MLTRSKYSKFSYSVATTECSYPGLKRKNSLANWKYPFITGACFISLKRNVKSPCLHLYTSEDGSSVNFMLHVWLQIVGQLIFSYVAI